MLSRGGRARQGRPIDVFHVKQIGDATSMMLKEFAKTRRVICLHSLPLAKGWHKDGAMHHFSLTALIYVKQGAMILGGCAGSAHAAAAGAVATSVDPFVVVASVYLVSRLLVLP